MRDTQGPTRTTTQANSRPHAARHIREGRPVTCSIVLWQRQLNSCDKIGPMNSSWREDLRRVGRRLRGLPLIDRLASNDERWSAFFTAAKHVEFESMLGNIAELQLQGPPGQGRVPSPQRVSREPSQVGRHALPDLRQILQLAHCLPWLNDRRRAMDMPVGSSMPSLAPRISHGCAFTISRTRLSPPSHDRRS